LHRCAVLILAVLLLLAAPARAADPIMPLSEVRAGMLCTGQSVVRGTEISSFDVEVLDVIADDTLYGGARLLIRVSGPAVEATGVGPGFSGSPIFCDGRNAGAISEAIGEYGNKVVLATPIEAILGARPTAPASARRAPELLRAARSLAGPLTVGGLSPSTRRLLSRAAARVDRHVLVAPPGPQGGYPVQDLRPGAAIGAGISSGDISFGAVGTVAYRDGDQVYAFGHQLDAGGKRALFLQDSYVFGVIGNPVAIPDIGAITYKLTSSGGHTQGAITNDTFSAISGTLGAGPPTIPLYVSGRLRGSGERVSLNSLLADERALGYGAGIGLIAPLAASTAVDRLLGSFEPAAVTVCTRFRVRQLRKPFGVCNAYFDSFAAFTGVSQATSMVDAFDLAPLDIRSVRVRLAVQPGFEDDVVVGARGPRRVRPGTTVPVEVSLRRRGGSPRSLTVEVPIPRSLRPGERTLVIAGNGSGGFEEEILVGLLGDLIGFGEFEDPGADPRSIPQLVAAVRSLRQPLGIEARWRRREPRVVLASNEIRYSGRARVRLQVLPARR
jgi:hypothetical protein